MYNPFLFFNAQYTGATSTFIIEALHLVNTHAMDKSDRGALAHVWFKKKMMWPWPTGHTGRPCLQYNVVLYAFVYPFNLLQSI